VLDVTGYGDTIVRGSSGYALSPGGRATRPSPTEPSGVVPPGTWAHGPLSLLAVSAYESPHSCYHSLLGMILNYQCVLLQNCCSSFAAEAGR
jgi:hypothetical protein